MNAHTKPVISLQVIKRNGQVVPFDRERIRVAVAKCYMDPRVFGEGGADSSMVSVLSNKITEAVTACFTSRQTPGGIVHIEEIQDQVELALMRAGEHQAARYYVIYRSERQAAREIAKPAEESNRTFIRFDGERENLTASYFKPLVESACVGLDCVSAGNILKESLKNMYDGLSESQAEEVILITSATLIEKDPEYSCVAARLKIHSLRKEAMEFLGIDGSDSGYPEIFPTYVSKGIELGLLDARLKQFDINRLANAIVADRDLQFKYLGVKTLYDRYFIHSENGQRFETPQCFFMRIAMGLAINEPDSDEKAIEFYNLLSSFDFMSSSPTLFNAGTKRPQLSSCYLTTVPDDAEGIFKSYSNNGMLSKWAGGLGNDWTPVRALGSHIKGTNGKSQGIVPFLKVANDLAVAINQGGKRRGAVCAYLETWHLDIEEFLTLRKNVGDDRRRTHDMNIANWVPDLFMERLFKDEQWTLFSPNEVPDLHELYGAAFRSRYEEYERQAQQGLIRLTKCISAKKLWRDMLSMLFETGHPWLTFKDPCNIRSPQQHVGVVHSSNLCTEITLNTSATEIAVCNLGSINLAQHTNKDGVDQVKLKQTICTAVRMLDNVIDINFYPVREARNANLKHRPVGLGLMGFQDALYIQGIDYGSQGAVEFADISMESISYYAIEASANLADERGSYKSFKGSLWSKGILPIDSVAMLKAERGDEYLKMDSSCRMDWTSLREKAKGGMRNSNVMAIAPTATIANIVGVSASIEPCYEHIYAKSNLSGEFTVVNQYLVDALKAEDLWDQAMINDLKFYDGSIAKIERIPEAIKTMFRTAFEIEPRWLVEAASRRQKWLDQAQSLNIYISNADGKKLDLVYRMAWLMGVKTTYYLRARAATSAEKSTVASHGLNAVSSEMPVKACSIDDSDCEACQ